MTKFFISILVLTTLFSCQTKKNIQSPTTDMHNSQNSLDWEGTYTGLIQDGQCNGKLVILKLARDLTFSEVTHNSCPNNPSQTSIVNGNIKWNDDKNSITLFNENNKQHARYSVIENALTHTGNNSLSLQKELYSIEEKYWKLIELNKKNIVVDDKFIKESHIIFKDLENKIIGFGGCNRIMGTYDIQNNNIIDIHEILNTRVKCEASEIENEFINSIQKAQYYYISSDKLIVLDEQLLPIATFIITFLR